MYTNSKCTLFLKSLNYGKVTIDCFITHKKTASYSKNGLSYPESAFIMAMANDYTFNEGYDYVVEGQCNGVIDNTDQKTLSESMKVLKANYIVHTIMCADKKEYGSPSMRHTEISCK